MSKNLINIEMPDGTVIQDVPEGISQGEVLRRYTMHSAAMTPELLASRQAASKAAFDANAPSVIGGFGSELLKNAKAFGSAAMNTAPRADTGMDSPAVKLLAAAVPAGSASQGAGLVQALKASPAAAALQAVRSKFPSLANAGQKFEQIMGAAKDVPIDTSAAEQAVARAKELSQRGTTFPKVLSDFSKATKPVTADFAGQPVTMAPDPMTYEVGRDFASNSGRLSANEASRVAPVMKSQVSAFAKAMKDANREAAVKVGMGDLYDEAMKEYRRAATLQDAADVLKKYAVKATIYAGLGAAGAAGYEAYQAVKR